MSVVLDDAVVRRAAAKLRSVAHGDEESARLADALETALQDGSMTEEIGCTAEELMKMSPERRDRIMAAQAAGAAHLYEADLELPLGERDLTAPTSWNADPVRSPDEYLGLP